MKKHPSGFVPINFKLGGKILFSIALALMLLKGLDYLMGWPVIPAVILFIGIAFLILSCYLIFVVPKE